MIFPTTKITIQELIEGLTDIINHNNFLHDGQKLSVAVNTEQSTNKLGLFSLTQDIEQYWHSFDKDIPEHWSLAYPITQIIKPIAEINGQEPNEIMHQIAFYSNDILSRTIPVIEFDKNNANVQLALKDSISIALEIILSNNEQVHYPENMIEDELTDNLKSLMSDISNIAKIDNDDIQIDEIQLNDIFSKNEKYTSFLANPNERKRFALALAELSNNDFNAHDFRDYVVKNYEVTTMADSLGAINNYLLNNREQYPTRIPFDPPRASVTQIQFATPYQTLLASLAYEVLVKNPSNNYLAKILSNITLELNDYSVKLKEIDGQPSELITRRNEFKLNSGDITLNIEPKKLQKLLTQESKPKNNLTP